MVDVEVVGIFIEYTHTFIFNVMPCYAMSITARPEVLDMVLHPSQIDGVGQSLIKHQGLGGGAPVHIYSKTQCYYYRRKLGHINITMQWNQGSEKHKTSFNVQ